MFSTNNFIFGVAGLTNRQNRAVVIDLTEVEQSETSNSVHPNQVSRWIRPNIVRPMNIPPPTIVRPLAAQVLEVNFKPHRFANVNASVPKNRLVSSPVLLQSLGLCRGTVMRRKDKSRQKAKIPGFWGQKNGPTALLLLRAGGPALLESVQFISRDNGVLVGVEKNPGPASPVVCKKCNATVTDIKTHLKTAHPYKAASKKCNKCGLEVADIMDHLKKVHPFTDKEAKLGKAKSKLAVKANAKSASLVNVAVKDMADQLAGAVDALEEIKAVHEEEKQETIAKEERSSENSLGVKFLKALEDVVKDERKNTDPFGLKDLQAREDFDRYNRGRTTYSESVPPHKTLRKKRKDQIVLGYVPAIFCAERYIAYIMMSFFLIAVGVVCYRMDSKEFYDNKTQETYTSFDLRFSRAGPSASFGWTKETRELGYEPYECIEGSETLFDLDANQWVTQYFNYWQPNTRHTDPKNYKRPGWCYFHISNGLPWPFYTSTELCYTKGLTYMFSRLEGVFKIFLNPLYFLAKYSVMVMRISFDDVTFGNFVLAMGYMFLDWVCLFWYCVCIAYYTVFFLYVFTPFWITLKIMFEVVRVFFRYRCWVTDAPWMLVAAYAEMLVPKYSRLVAVPIYRHEVEEDFAPEFDREERRAPHFITTYQLAIDTKWCTGHSYDCYRPDSLSLVWSDKKDVRMLAKIRMIDGLLPTITNRKTRAGPRSSFAELVKTSHRLLSANSHYHDDPEYVKKGGSCYYDMSLVAAALVGGSVVDVEKSF